jgi:hypothetical protein
VINADALSDLALALVCATVAFANWRVRPALAQASALFCVAASFGVLRFSDIDFALGPHRFFSLLGACVAFPLLALALRWPDDVAAQRANAAARFGLLLGAIGVAMHLSGFGLWRQILPVISVLLIVVTAINGKQLHHIFGALLLVLSLVVAVLGQSPTFMFAPLNATQLMHYLLAVGIAMLVWPQDQRSKAQR